MKLTERLREAIEKSDKSRYQLAKETGIHAATLCRFLHGERGMSLDNLDTLAETLGLELRPVQKSPKKGR